MEMMYFAFITHDSETNYLRSIESRFPYSRLGVSCPWTYLFCGKSSQFGTSHYETHTISDSWEYPDGPGSGAPCDALRRRRETGGRAHGCVRQTKNSTSALPTRAHNRRWESGSWSWMPISVLTWRGQPPDDRTRKNTILYTAGTTMQYLITSSTYARSFSY